MPGTLQLSRDSTPFGDVLDAVLARLAAGVTGVTIDTTAIPEDQLHQYEAQDGLLVHVSTPLPVPKCGAGRYNKRVFRFVTVVILTQSLLDPAGKDLIAVKAHIAREEAVADALDLIGPVGSGTNIRTGIICEWVDGGEDIARKIKSDPGMLKGSLRFRIEYCAPMNVIRN